MLLAGALALGYWFVYRPLPQTSGTVQAPISQRATVARDSLGVPHLSAGTIEDALFLQGYVTAQDRLWQMDTLRRLAAGRLAEVFGAAALESDREARRLRMEHLAEDRLQALAASDRATLAAYARGVNFFLETHRHNLPLEFTLLGYDPRPWRVVDSILVYLQIYRTLTESWRIELQKKTLLEGGEPGKVALLFPVRTGFESGPGSNAWALAGSRTASGRPLLSNDPHLEYSIPSIWYMVQLQTPGLNVIGVSFPGLPGVILGHNDRIAWGATNVQFDVQDLYIEKLDGQSGRYWFRGQLEQARLEHETIPVRGGSPVTFAQWVTRHGPVIAVEGNQYLALRWVAAEQFGLAAPLLDLDRARNWQEFRAALARHPGPMQSFMYADVDGNIGYQVAGRAPIRKTYDGDLPVDGSSGAFEWEGFIPFEQLPQAYNPASGVIVAANQNPFPPNYPYRVNGVFDPTYRFRQIHALLSAHNRWRPDEMLAVQKDVYSAFSHYLARQVVAACDRRGVTNPGLRDGIALLRAFNGQMEQDQAAPFIVALTYQHLRKAFAERASPGQGAGYDYLMAPAALEKLLRTQPADWFTDYDQLLLRTFVDAIEEGRRIQGRDVRKWSYGRYNQLLITHPVGHHLPLVSGYFDIGPLPESGSSTTVRQITRKLAPSMRMTVDLSDWDRSYQNIVTGQSGQILSPYYKDQWEAYYEGRSFPMQFQKVEAKQTLEFTAETRRRGEN